MPVANRRISLQSIAPQSVHQVSTRVSTQVSTRVSTGTGLKRFTAAQLAGLSGNGKKQDLTDPAVRGLVLRIGKTGTKYWLFRYKWKGSATRIALGEFPTVGLAEAREKAQEHRLQLTRGIDPRNAERTPGIKPRTNLKPVAPKPAPRLVPVVHRPPVVHPTSPARISPHIEAPAADDRSSVQYLAFEYVKHFVVPNRERPEEAIRILNKDILPYWSNRDARSISHREVIERLDTVVARGARVMANHTAKILRQMFKYGIHRAIVQHSPVQLLFSPGGREKPRDRALNEQELTAFVQGIDAVCASPQKAAAIMLLLLTLQRRSSLALAEWQEVDLESRVWNIPAQHDKMRRAHSLPLNDWAIDTFRILKNYSADSRFVLPTRGGTSAASPQLITRSVTRLQDRFKAIGIGNFTTHDLRRTGRTQLAKLGITKEVAERILNHSTEQIEATYNVYDYMDEKRDALERWESRLLELKDAVTGKPTAESIMAEILKETLEQRSLAILQKRMVAPAIKI